MADLDETELKKLTVRPQWLTRLLLHAAHDTI